MSEHGAFFDYVHKGAWDKTPQHSGILSPVGWLDPKYDVPFEKRLKALHDLAHYAQSDYAWMAIRALEFYAYSSPEPVFRQIARQAIGVEPAYEVTS